MKDQSTRRFFLRNVLMASVGISVLPLRASSKREFYSPDLKTNFKLGGLHDKSITVTGKIYDKTGLQTRSDTAIEVWYLSPVTKKFEYAKNIRTNKAGEYMFTTDFPEKELGNLARIHFKVASKERSYETELLVSDFGAYVTDKHWALNSNMGENLFPRQQSTENITELIFNLSI
jgi:protocatechuate 3,4-dioxygenase beta subunit